MVIGVMAEIVQRKVGLSGGCCHFQFGDQDLIGVEGWDLIRD